MPLPRPLTTSEKAVAWSLLETAQVLELDVLAQQLEAASVVHECECVCPTVSLSVDAERAVQVGYSGKPVATADYDGGSIMIWVEDGWLSHLEIYWGYDDAPTEFPPLDALENHRAE